MRTLQNELDLALLENLTAERVELREELNAKLLTMHEVEQIAGKALGYPLEPVPPGETTTDVCIGDHVPESIVAELAKKYGELRAGCAKRVEGGAPDA